MQTSQSAPVADPILNSALKVGAVTGAAGVLVGGANAILRGSPTVGLFSALTGLNSALLGASYWVVRATMIRALQDPGTQTLRLREKAYVSGAAGAVAGGFVALALGKPRSALPGALVWGLVGISGQSLYNLVDARHTDFVMHEEERGRNAGLSFWEHVMRSKWSPVTRLTAEEYEDMLRGKLLTVEADLAIVNEDIARLEKMKIEQHAAAPPPPEKEL